MHIYPNRIINKDLVFQANALFEEFVLLDFYNWSFRFADNIYICGSGLWRLLENNKIKRVSTDHQQQFGLQAPIDLTEEINKILKGKNLKIIEIVENTGDLLLHISDNIKVQIFIDSSGYESYTFAFDNKTYLGQGAGDISMYENK